MERRKFIQNTLAAGSVIAASPLLAGELVNAGDKPFQLNYAPHFGMFKEHGENDFLQELEFMQEAGFRSFEDNEMRNRSQATQEQIARAMDDLGMTMGVFVAHKIYWDQPNLASGDPEYRKEFLQYITDSVEVAKRVNARWMTVVPGHVDLRKDMGYQMANVVETLKQASAILEPHELIMVLEPLNFRDHPGLFLTKSAQAYEICKAVNSPSCKILFDIYHQQIQEGNLIPNIEASWDEIAYFQIGDNPGRNEPGTGEINYQNVFKYIHSRGFDGVLGMEHGNSMEGKEGEKAVIESYRKADSF